MFVILFMSVSVVNAQNKAAKNKKSAAVITPASASAGWAEKDALKQLLTSTSAAAQVGNLAPARENGENFVMLSIAFAKSEYPAVNDNPEFRTVVGEFTDRCEELWRSIGAGKADEEIAFELTALNNSFAVIEQLQLTQMNEK